MNPFNLEFVPGHLKMQEMCNEAVCMDPYNLEFVPGHFKTQKMCNQAGSRKLYPLEQHVSDHLKTQEM